MVDLLQRALELCVGEPHCPTHTLGVQQTQRPLLQEGGRVKGRGEGGSSTHGAGVEDGRPVCRNAEGGDDKQVHEVTQKQRNDHQQQRPSQRTLDSLQQPAGQLGDEQAASLACHKASQSGQQSYTQPHQVQAYGHSVDLRRL